MFVSLRVPCDRDADQSLRRQDQERARGVRMPTSVPTGTPSPPHFSQWEKIEVFNELINTSILIQYNNLN